MTHELGILFGAGFIYLLLLFLVAYAADSGRIPERLIRHPLVYALSLGVYATSWSYYGSVGFAQSEGYLFLTIYIGVTLAFALTPVLLQPILRLTLGISAHLTGRPVCVPLPQPAGRRVSHPVHADRHPALHRAADFAPVTESVCGS